jgi:hypothetical protein
VKNSSLQKIKNLESRDTFGSECQLAPGGYEKILKSQSRLWELLTELNAIGALFRNMQTSDMDADEYYGISLCLLRMGRRLGKIQIDLETALKNKK